MPAVIALLFMAVQAHAGEIEPRAYVNTPVEINFLLAATVCESEDLYKNSRSGRNTCVAREPEQLDQTVRQHQLIHQRGE